MIFCQQSLSSNFSPVQTFVFPPILSICQLIYFQHSYQRNIKIYILSSDSSIERILMVSHCTQNKCKVLSVHSSQKFSDLAATKCQVLSCVFSCPKVDFFQIPLRLFIPLGHFMCCDSDWSFLMDQHTQSVSLSKYYCQRLLYP